MRILVVGGGSGGHITPAVATIRELAELKPRAKVEFWTDKKYYNNVAKILAYTDKDEKYVTAIKVRKIAAGKFHRYAGWDLATYFRLWRVTLKDLVWGNIVGFCGFVAGLVQSFARLVVKKTRPDVIFLKGGFVGLPVGLVARLLKIPYVIHESDTVPGLANRVLMKGAKVVAMGMPFEEGAKNWEWVGIPVAPEFKPVSDAKQKSLKKVFSFDENEPLVVITGGSQGSEHINEAVREILPELMKISSVALVAGRKHYEDMVDLKKYEEWEDARLKSNFRLWEFNSTMNELMGAADVVVSRAGATTIAELAALKKAVVLVPFERLPGGHQVKNAERLEKKGAVSVVMDEKMGDQPGLLFNAVKHLIKSEKVRREMAENLHEEAKPDAAKRLAEILIEVAKGDEKR